MKERRERSRLNQSRAGAIRVPGYRVKREVKSSWLGESKVLKSGDTIEYAVTLNGKKVALITAQYYTHGPKVVYHKTLVCLYTYNEKGDLEEQQTWSRVGVGKGIAIEKMRGDIRYSADWLIDYLEQEKRNAEEPR